MSNKRVVTRMAPSPTGEFHIGSMRTLLYNWAYAKKNNGHFILRIEDTDRTRFVEGSMERTLQVIKDYGFSWDEGPLVGGPNAPYIQSERLDIYQKYAVELVSQGKAYYCFCTAESLTKMREEQKAKGIFSTKYDGRCSHLSTEEVLKKLSNNEPHVIRLKVPKGRMISWVDGVLGQVSFDSSEIDDQVLLKSDGFPTYHLGVVIDDHHMNVTHIMRGIEWLSSTPKHILLYEAFGWDAPEHLHLPNLKELGSTKKLSKRYGPVSARGFLDDGYLPDALVNYLMFLGWNPGTEKEIYSLDEFIKDFSLEKIHKTDLVAFDRQKLDWYNSQYIKMKSDEELAKLLAPYAPEEIDETLLLKIAPLVKERIKKLSEFSGISQFFFSEPKIDKELFSKDMKNHLSLAIKVLEALPAWTSGEMNNMLMPSVKEHGFKAGDFFMDMRIAITGQKVTPPLNESMEILGKDVVLSRLQNALQ